MGSLLFLDGYQTCPLGAGHSVSVLGSACLHSCPKHAYPCSPVCHKTLCVSALSKVSLSSFMRYPKQSYPCIPGQAVILRAHPFRGAPKPSNPSVSVLSVLSLSGVQPNLPGLRVSVPCVVPFCALPAVRSSLCKESAGQKMKHQPALNPFGSVQSSLI